MSPAHGPDATGTQAPGQDAAGGVAAVLAALRADPRVATAGPHPDPAPRPVLLATPDSVWFAERRAAEAEALSRRHARRWEMIYDGAFHADGPPRPPDFTTWTSGLTRAPIPEPRMRAWLDATLARLRAVPHDRVLDLGCGIGLVVAALAPECREYHALDASAEAIATLGAWTRTQERLSHVRLSHRPAHDLADMASGSVDLVILNSVVQYFPDLAYLLRVLREAERCLAPRGHVFLGDLRLCAPLPAHAAALALAHAPADATAAGLRAAAAATLAANRELALDPSLFAAGPPLLARLTGVRFGLKPADADAELAAYRFDAMLALDGAPAPVAPGLAWDALGPDATLEHLAAHLRRAGAGALAVLGIPNARTSRDAALARRLADAPPAQAAATLAGTGDAGGIEPEALAALAASLGHAVELRPTPGSPEGRFDALLHRVAAAWPRDAGTVTPANDPLAAELAEGLRSGLQRVADAVAGRGTVLVRVVTPEL